jgi:hypothetical protein
MKSKNPWLDFEQLNNACKNKRVIFWGCFDFFEKTIAVLDLNIDFIVDINPHLHGEKAHHGFDVRPPSYLWELGGKADYFVIISSSAFYEIIEQLDEHGFKPGSEYAVTPVLKNFKVLEDILGHQATLILSSSDAPRHDRLGGGLFLLDTRTGEFEKKISGVTRGFAWHNDTCFVVDAQKGVRILDNDFEERDCIKLPHGSVPHGLAIDSENKFVYVTLSRHDRIGVFSLDSLSEVNSIMLSQKFERSDRIRYHHHANDICIDGESLFVSMFSSSGNLKREWFDGSILEYDLHEQRFVGSIANNLWQPHSVKIMNGKLSFLDSMRGALHIAAHKVETRFNGFVRGLDCDDSYYFIGQSIHRYFDRMKGVSDNIAVDAGVFIYDSDSKATRFLPTLGIRDINTLAVL